MNSPQNMSKIIKIDPNIDSNTAAIWNEVAHHPMQSFEWGQIRSKHGVEVVMLAMTNGDEEIFEEVLLMTIHQIPKVGKAIGYVPKSQFPSEAMMQTVDEYAKKFNCIFVKFEPNIDVSTKVTIPKIFRTSPHPIFTKWNQVLCIENKSEEELLASFHHKTRYNIKLAQKKGVIVREMSNNDGYKIFEKLYFETCRRQKYRGHTPGYHSTIWENLKKIDSPIPHSLSSHIMVAFYKSLPLCAYQLWQFKNIMYYVYGGSSVQNRHVMAPNMLMWESIRLAKNQGCKAFDMWGSLSPSFDKKDPWAGFTKFKEGYATTYAENIGSFDRVYQKIPYLGYNIAHKIRSKII